MANVIIVYRMNPKIKVLSTITLLSIHFPLWYMAPHFLYQLLFIELQACLIKSWFWFFSRHQKIFMKGTYPLLLNFACTNHDPILHIVSRWWNKKWLRIWRFVELISNHLRIVKTFPTIRIFLYIKRTILQMNSYFHTVKIKAMVS